jgi:hypothetical protein
MCQLTSIYVNLRQLTSKLQQLYSYCTIYFKILCHMIRFVTCFIIVLKIKKCKYLIKIRLSYSKYIIVSVARRIDFISKKIANLI